MFNNTTKASFSQFVWCTVALEVCNAALTKQHNDDSLTTVIQNKNMTQQPQEFTPTKELLEPSDDAWLLPDGTLYNCAPAEHSQCAAWIVNHVIVDQLPDWERKRAIETPARAFLEKSGALLIRGNTVMGDVSAVLTNGQANLRPTSAQLGVIEENGLAVYNTLNGTIVSGEVYEKAAHMLSERATQVFTTDWFLRRKKIAEQYLSGTEDLNSAFVANLQIAAENNTYKPGMFKPGSMRISPVEDPDSVAHFAQSPFEGQIHMGDASQEDRDEVYGILTADSVAGVSVNIRQERNLLNTGMRVKEDAYHFRLVPVDGEQCCLVIEHDYYHDGLSQDYIPYYLETTITAGVLSYKEASTMIAKRIDYYRGDRNKIDITVKEFEGDSSLLPALENLHVDPSKKPPE